MTASRQAALDATVHGLVQGVGFRAFVVTQSRALGLDGFTRNLGDERTVEIIAEGPRDRLEALLKALRVGPSASHVERVVASWSEPTGAYAGFEMR